MVTYLSSRVDLIVLAANLPPIGFNIEPLIGYKYVWSVCVSVSFWEKTVLSWFCAKLYMNNQ
jgi:hypothetical protein